MYWEAVGDGSAVRCPGCLTGEEEQQLDEDMFQVQAAADLETLREIDRLGPAG